MDQTVVKNEETKDIGELISDAFLLAQGKADREDIVLDYLCQSISKADNYDALVAKAKKEDPYAFIQLASWHLSHAENVKDYCMALNYAKKAVSFHYVEGYYILGQLYFYGTGCEKNIVRALKYFQYFIEQVDQKQLINDAVLKDAYLRLIEGNIKLRKLDKAVYYIDELKALDGNMADKTTEYEVAISNMRRESSQGVYRQALRLLTGVLFLLLMLMALQYIFPELKRIDLSLDKPMRKQVSNSIAEPEQEPQPEPEPVYYEAVTQPEPKEPYSLLSSFDFYRYELNEVAPTNVWASTEYISSKGVDYGANCLIDQDESTQWQEGVDGSGVGECIHFDFSDEILLSGMIITNGKVTSKEAYYDNNRLASFEIKAEDSILIELKDNFEKQYIYFSEPISANSFDLIIDSVFQGLKYNDTCITDIVFLTK